MTKPLTQSHEEYNRLQRERQRRYVPKVSRRQLHLFRNNPLREEQLRVSDYVVCRECGAMLMALIGGAWSHIALVHKESRSEYEFKWPGAPFFSRAHLDVLSKRAKRQMDHARGKPRTDLKSVRGHESEGPAPKWPIACALANGQSYKTAGKQNAVKRSPPAVWSAAQSMGLTEARVGKRVGTTLWDFGEPITAVWSKRLLKASGLLIKEFAEQVGIARAIAESAIRARRKGQRLSPQVAAKLVHWRNECLHWILQTAPKADFRTGRYSGSRVLRTFFPDLHKNYELLRAMIPSARQFATSKEFGEHICHLAMIETVRTPKRRLFSSFLPWAAQAGEKDVASFIERHWRLFTQAGMPGSIASQILAAELGTTPAVVGAAVKKGAVPIPAREMRHMLTPAPVRQVQAISRRSRSFGPAKTPIEQTVWFAIGRRVEEMISQGKTLQEARKHVATNKTCEYGTIVRYHMRYRAHHNCTNPMT